jgi:hypothetical protein
MNTIILHNLLMVILFNDDLRAEFTRWTTTDGKNRMHSVSQWALLDINVSCQSFFFYLLTSGASTGEIIWRLNSYLSLSDRENTENCANGNTWT